MTCIAGHHRQAMYDREQNPFGHADATGLANMSHDPGFIQDHEPIHASAPAFTERQSSRLEKHVKAKGKKVFPSFWMAGYEGADHINSSGTALDMGALTQHVEQAGADYEMLRDFGISTVRESAGWRLIEKNGHFDFSSLQSRLEAARRCDIQIAWTLCHYGWPDDLDIFNDQWLERFARFCRKTCEFLAGSSDVIPVFTPINEISFLTWAICETCLIHPHRGERRADGYALKQRLVKASIAGCEAIWEIDPRARILNVDPMIHIVAPSGRPELAPDADRQRSFQFQAWDMLAGLGEPQLGGSAKYLDLVGINYYHGNQWEYQTEDPLHWHLNDARRVRLRDLLTEAYERYGHPLVLAETSHVGVGRGAWIREVAEDIASAVTDGIPIEGVCLYPIIDRPDWEHPGHWHNSGLWDLHCGGAVLERRLCQPYAHQLQAAQRSVCSVFQPFEGHQPGVTSCHHL